MKAGVKSLIGVAILGVGLGAYIFQANTIEADSASANPGSIDDPVVTKSYVDEQIAKLTGNGSNSGGTGSETEAGTSLKVVTVGNGKTLIASEGAEVIVRAGKAVVYSLDPNGIADVTAGADLTNGQKVPLNHLVWFPRPGRGITTDPSYAKSLTVLVKGSYTIK